MLDLLLELRSALGRSGLPSWDSSLPWLAEVSALYLPYISRISHLYLPHISPALARRGERAERAHQLLASYHP